MDSAPIRHPVVVHADEHPRELSFDGVELAQGQRTLIQLSLLEAGTDNLIDNASDVIGSRIVEDAGRGLDPIGQHRDGRLATLRLWTRGREVARR